jgi:hypothetical protein
MTRFWQAASPSARRLYQAYLGEAANRGEIHTSRGRTIVSDVTATEKILLSLGFVPTRVAIEKEKVGFELKRQRRISSVRQHFMERLEKPMVEGDAFEVNKILEEAFGEGHLIDRRSMENRFRSKATNILDEMRQKYRRTYIPEEDR